ncbi:MAG: aspartyl protease family protein [Acidobacteriaceae bacterium]|nr:aspartyl protease family protein [Acidobacteriaceae bacterium]
MRPAPAAVSLCLLLIPFAISSADPDAGLAAYKAADFKTAIPLLQAAVAKTPKDPALQGALLSSLVYEGHVDEAAALSAEDEESFPNSPDVMAARGDFAFYMGDMAAAEKLWVAAANQKNHSAHAYYGLYRLYKAASMYRAARLRCFTAYQLDPDDALIAKAWMNYLPADKRKDALPAFVAAHPWLYPKYDARQETTAAVDTEIKDHKAFELDGDPKEEDVRLYELRDSPTRVRGVGVEFSINGSRPLHLLLDTGASGILLSQSAIDKAGLQHLGTTESWGIGDKGIRSGFVAVSDNCRIGPLSFKTCVVEALEGKGRVAGDEDGLIGTDVFAAYLIHIDFQQHLMHLSPLPPRPPNPQEYDRETGPAQNGFSPVFRFGHQLMIPTTLNDKSTGLFLIDTGSNMSNVDSTFARLSTKIHGNEYMRVHGISGEVKDVFEADKAVIRFAVYRQRNIGLTAFNLNNSPYHEEVRMDGILGLPVLSLFRLTLDYRNGLVKFDYVLK